MHLLRDLDPQRFLADYWQQKPLLVRQAWPEFVDPLEPKELAGLACEDGVSARLVLEHGRTPWELRTGPFAESEFTALPASHWTLLVSDVEKYLPELVTLIEPFRFVPDWRIDDVQISYAAPQGSVGPHWDDYDVFLLQGRGRKRWQLDTRPVTPGNFRDDTQLRILREFEPVHDWVLEPGDLLYLPPRVAHHGVALDAGLTYSIGFRAPAASDLLAGFVDHLLERLDPGLRYTDPGLALQDNPGEITPAALERVEQLLRTALDQDRAGLQRWFGCQVTEPKPGFEPEPPETPWTREALAERLRGDEPVRRTPGTRFACCNTPSGLDLFVGGRALTLDADAAGLGEALCQQLRYPADELAAALDHDPSAALLLALFNDGLLEFAED